MSAVLVDSNVLLDVVTADPNWSTWSARAIEAAANEGRLLINSIIYAEVSVGFLRIEDVEAAIPAVLFERAPLPYEAAFLAGKTYLRYRRQGGVRRSPLPDFYIGAHAVIGGYRLLTRDVAPYRTYFPSVTLIAP
jgi:predicted nucleic acid-binding protein